MMAQANPSTLHSAPPGSAVADRAAAEAAAVFAKALHDAAKTGDVATIHALVQAGADPNAADQLGWTAIMFASWSLDAVRVLVQLGADPASANNDGVTARDVAKSNGHPHVVAYLESLPSSNAVPSSATVRSSPAAPDFAAAVRAAGEFLYDAASAAGRNPLDVAAALFGAVLPPHESAGRR